MERRPSDASRDDPEIGTFVGKYRIVAELGRGGMAVVYRAWDEALHREVALKSPLPTFLSAVDQRRFLHEARAASRVAHANIVPIYDVLEQDGRPWIAMELMEGRSLRRVLDTERRLSVEASLLLGEQIAEALDAAHARGLLHRDVKPSNIMMPQRGGARLMDFGLARAHGIAQGSSVTSVGHGIAGTLGYASPEQILSRPLEPSSDIFSLGAVQYEMVSGRPAFPGDGAGQIFDATLSFDPPPITQLMPEAPDELRRIISKAIAKRPDERYQSARELAADLRTLRRRLESGTGSAIVPPHPWGGVSLSFPSIAVIAAVTVAAGAAVLWWFPRGDVSPLQGPPHQLTTASGWESEPAVAPDSALVAYTSDQSGNSDIWLLDVSTGASLRVTDDPAVDRAPTWFPDGKTIAFVSDRGGVPSVWKVPRLGGTATRILENAEDPAISPDGSRLAFARRDVSGYFRIMEVALADPEHPKTLTSSAMGLWDHLQPAWSPDGRQIVYSAWRDLWIVAADGSASRRLTVADMGDRDAAWSPDGTFIFFSSNRGGVLALWRISANGGTPMRLTGGQGPETQPSVSADGKRLVYSTFVDNVDLAIRDLRSGEEQTITSERTEHSPIFSPDGHALVFTSDRWAGRYDLWLQPLDGIHPSRAPERLTDQSGSVAQPSFSPDGNGSLTTASTTVNGTSG